MNPGSDHEAEITAALLALGLLKPEPSAEAGPAPNNNTAELSLPGPGPFLLPLCGQTVKLVLGELIMVLQVETLEGQRLDIPLPVAALGGLAHAAIDALKQLATGR